MKRLLFYTIVVGAAVSLSLSCGHGKGAKNQEVATTRPFPEVTVPSMLSTPEERSSYIAEHFWDAYFAGDGVTDADYVLGVSNKEIAQGVADFVSVLEMIPMSEAQDAVARLFDKIEAAQDERDTSVHVYPLLTQAVATYLYDPNSPLRNDDYYLPFVERLAKSKYTDSTRRSGYEFEARMCRLNPYGSKAPDFMFKDLSGRVWSLYDIEASYTVMFFSNPGCNACRSIIDAIESRPYFDTLIENKKVAVVNIYIDDELDKWREYAPEYPTNWYNGYDYKKVITSDLLYYVRAIPDLYVLDKDKKIIYKDIPVEKMLSFFDNLVNNE